jgi:protein-tyrosine phosphatase
MSEQRKIRVLMVCLGNICRSPTAEGIFRHRVSEAGLGDVIETDSAGTHGFHVNEPPDSRAQAVAAERGIDLGDIRSRRFSPYDFGEFDYILAMDDENLAVLRGNARDRDEQDRIYRMLDFAGDTGEREVPDPYYGPSGGFERVFDLLEDASAGLLSYLKQTHKL